MNSNKTGNPGKIVKKVFVSTVGMVWGAEIVKKNWYSYMVLGKKLKIFIGTAGMMRGKKLIILWYS